MRKRAAISEVEIERDAYQLPIEKIVAALVDLAGVVVTAIIGGVKDERSVRNWIAGDHQPESAMRLRFAYRIARMIATRCGTTIVQPWFKGANASLGENAPAIMLRDDFSEAVQQAVLRAARRLTQ